MKAAIIMSFIALGCAGCASSQPTDEDGEARSAASQKPKKESDCKYVRNSGGISRIRRSCN